MPLSVPYRQIPRQHDSYALDFAYLIHTEIGNKAIAAKVNMRLVPLSHNLKSGDQVEIITAERAHPKMEWISFLQTRYARNRVIEYFRRDFDTIARDGKRIFSERIRLMGLKSSKELLRRFQDYSQIRDEKELYFRIGLGLLGPEEFKAIINEKDFSNGGRRKAPSREENVHAIEYRIAECCHPIPGDPVIGFSAGENLVMVHKKR